MYFLSRSPQPTNNNKTSWNKRGNRGDRGERSDRKNRKEKGRQGLARE